MRPRFRTEKSVIESTALVATRFVVPFTPAGHQPAQTEQDGGAATLDCFLPNYIAGSPNALLVPREVARAGGLNIRAAQAGD